MRFILDRKFKGGINHRFVVACEGYSDVGFISALLEHHNITNCCVGCPSREGTGGEGKDKLPEYLVGLKAALINYGTTIDGLLVVVDADTDQAGAFQAATRAMGEGIFPAPAAPFSIETIGGMRTAVYIIPGPGLDGTLEHLLLTRCGTRA